MRKYLEMAKSQIKIFTNYSAWYWTGMVSVLLRLVIQFYFWHAVYANRTHDIGSLSLDGMITYMVWATLLGDFATWGPGQQLAKNIRDGSIAIELMRPYDMMGKLIAMDLGGKFAAVFREVVPTVIVTLLFLHLQGPGSVWGGLLFVSSAVCGVLVGTLFDLLFGTLAFWTVNLFGLNVLKTAIMMFFSGALVPTSLFPHWLQAVNLYLPFQAMVYVPVSIYTGTLSGTAAFVAMAVQAFWLVALYVLLRFIWSQALRKVTIFGG